MAIYAIGDVQGCYDELRKLLDKIKFDPQLDQIWSCGDLVNRGPKSLKTLRFCRDLGGAFRMVLGNHDLHLLSVGRGHRPARVTDTFGRVLRASDRDELFDWLVRMPLFMYDAELKVAMVHAGISPVWSLQQCLDLSDELSAILQSPVLDLYLSSMYGNEPSIWSDALTGPARWRTATNYFTRMRFCDAAGKLELLTNSGPDTAPPGYRPWYEHASRVMETTPVVFGHWAALMGKTTTSRAIAIDTGCAWGFELTACNLSNGFERTSVKKLK